MAESVKDSSFPVTLARDVPVYSGTVGDEDTVLAIISNARLRRIPVSTFTEGSATVVPPPSSPASPGESGNIAVNEDGFFSYLNGTWGMSPRITSHWEDFTDQTRFLIVDRDQGLSPEEQQQGRENLDVVTATAEKEGLVLLKTTLSSGDTGEAVPTVGALIQYLQATYGESGGSSDVVHATTDVYGIVKLAKVVSGSDMGVPTAKQVYDFISGGEDVKHATVSVYGTVRLATAITSSNKDIPTAGQVYDFVTTMIAAGGGVGAGGIPGDSVNVSRATTSTYGTVVLATSIADGSQAVPTAGQVDDFVNNKIDGLGGGGGSGGGGGDSIADYQGEVHIKGPNGEVILDYDSASHTLIVGKGITVLSVDSSPNVRINTSTQVI